MRYQVFIAGGMYLGTISHTLRVCEVAIGSYDPEWTKRIFKVAINQNPDGLLIIPEGEAKRSKVTSLAEIAPKLFPTKRPKKALKGRSNTNGRGSHFSKISPPLIKDLQAENGLIFNTSSIAGVV